MNNQFIDPNRHPTICQYVVSSRLSRSSNTLLLYPDSRSILLPVLQAEESASAHSMVSDGSRVPE